MELCSHNGESFQLVLLVWRVNVCYALASGDRMLYLNLIEKEIALNNGSHPVHLKWYATLASQ